MQFQIVLLHYCWKLYNEFFTVNNAWVELRDWKTAAWMFWDRETYIWKSVEIIFVFTGLCICTIVLCDVTYFETEVFCIVNLTFIAL